MLNVKTKDFTVWGKVFTCWDEHQSEPAPANLLHLHHNGFEFCIFEPYFLNWFFIFLFSILLSISISIFLILNHISLCLFLKDIYIYIIYCINLSVIYYRSMLHSDLLTNRLLIHLPFFTPKDKISIASPQILNKCQFNFKENLINIFCAQLYLSFFSSLTTDLALAYNAVNFTGFLPSSSKGFTLRPSRVLQENLSWSLQGFQMGETSPTVNEITQKPKFFWQRFNNIFLMSPWEQLGAAGCPGRNFVKMGKRHLKAVLKSVTHVVHSLSVYRSSKRIWMNCSWSQ